MLDILDASYFFHALLFGWCCEECQEQAPLWEPDHLIQVFRALRAGWVCAHETPSWVVSQTGRSCRARPPCLTELKLQGGIILELFYKLAEIGRPPAGLCQLGPAGSKFRPLGERRAFGPLQLKICSSQILNCFLWLEDQNSTLESWNIDIMPKMDYRSNPI